MAGCTPFVGHYFVGHYDGAVIAPSSGPRHLVGPCLAQTPDTTSDTDVSDAYVRACACIPHTAHLGQPHNEQIRHYGRITGGQIP